MATERIRRRFTPEFKKDAGALVTEQGYTIVKASQAVDIGGNNLRRWKKELERVAGGERLNAGEQAELARLRRQNKELRMEKEILKKASAFFAKEMK
ncbi:MAG: transposase [Sedimenticolaceae bacterium]